MASKQPPLALPRPLQKWVQLNTILGAPACKNIRTDPCTKFPDACILGSVYLSEKRKELKTPTDKKKKKKKKCVRFAQSVVPGTPKKKSAPKGRHPPKNAPAKRGLISFFSAGKVLHNTLNTVKSSSSSSCMKLVRSPAEMSQKEKDENCCHKNAVLNQWSEDNMRQAQAYFNDTHSMSEPPSIAEIASKYRIPHATLWKCVTGIVQGTGHMSGGKRNLHIFPKEDEDELAAVIKLYGYSGFAMTVDDLCYIAYEIAEERGYTGFNNETRMAGRKWTKGFMSRHCDVSLHTSSDVSVYRNFSANESTVNKWFDLFEKILTAKGVSDPVHIWNCNESGVQDVPTKRKVLGETGFKAYSTVPADKGETSTVLTAANARGDMMDPLVIMHGQRVQQS